MERLGVVVIAGMIACGCDAGLDGTYELAFQGTPCGRTFGSLTIAGDQASADEFDAVTTIEVDGRIGFTLARTDIIDTRMVTFRFVFDFARTDDNLAGTLVETPLTCTMAFTGTRT
jgi:hypothetical protein